MNKKEELELLKQKFNMIIKGLENYPKDEINIMVANHNCLMDIFFLPIAIPEDIVSYISPRLIYKKEIARQEMVEKYLYAMPVEAHGGKTYADICLNSATSFLKNDNSIAIFPEGAYVEENIVYRGRTGAARILFNCKELGINANLIPVAINIDKSNLDLNSYSLEGNNVTVTILPSINYIDYYNHYINNDNGKEKNDMLHRTIDDAFIQIADTLNREYCNEYIELFPKKNVIFENGETIPVDIAQEDHYVSLYKSQIDNRKNKILSRIKK